MNDFVKMMQRLTVLALPASLLASAVLAADAPRQTPRAEATTDATSWSSGVFEYDGAGDIKRVGDDLYRYDAHGRLASAEAATADSPVNAQEFIYDRYGNLLTVTTRTGTPAATVTDVAAYAVRPATNQLDDPTRCPANVTCRMARYDAKGSGNQIGYLQDDELRWDALGMMTELDSHRGDRHEQYIYDANDERIVVLAKTPQGAETERRFAIRGVDQKVSREMVFIPSTNTWTPPKDYVYRGAALIASFSSPSGAPDRHYHLDHLGSTRLLTDGTGQRLAVHTYWPFGQEARGSDADNERVKFTGHERDGSAAAGGLELDYMHARYYDANLRFLSVDPSMDIEKNAGAPQRWNRYAYATNNPITFFDPDGRDKKIYILQSFAFDATKYRWGNVERLASNGYEVDPHRFSSESTYTEYLAKADSTDFVFTFSHAAVTGISDASFLSLDSKKVFDNSAISGSALAAAVNRDKSRPAGIALIGCNTFRPAQELANSTRVAVVGSHGLVSFANDKKAINILTAYASKNGRIDQAAIDQVNKAICPAGNCSFSYALALPEKPK